MAVKLTKAQEAELKLIREQYAEKLQREKDNFKRDLDEAIIKKQDRWIQFYTKSLDLANQGFMLWRCPNSKTLQKLTDLGYIEYIYEGRQFRNSSPIDRVKLL